MSVTRAFYLVFHAPLRLGGGARDDADAARDFPSDTFSAALVVAAADLFGDSVHGRALGDVARDPPWVVSSLLPWASLGEGKRVRFFPRPAEHRFTGAGSATKAHRHVAYLSEDLLAPSPPVAHLSACHTLAASFEDIGRITWLRRVVRPSVTLDRVTSAPDLFHLQELAVGDVRPGQDARAGAWIAVRTKDQDGMRLVRGLLRHLEESGIGADRARGMGHVSVVDDEPLPLDESVRSTRMRILLGYASPDAALARALEDPRARYSVVRRGGRMQGAHGGVGLPTRGVARKVVRLLGPGSLIPDAGPVAGRTQDVTPEGFRDHLVFRDGRTLAWPLGGRT